MPIANPRAGVCGDLSTCAVRPASALDAEAMLPLIRAHAEYERCAAAASATELQHALAGAPPLLYAWLAETVDEIIGYATATLDFSTWSGRQFLHLDGLFVRANDRGSGVGARLLAAVRCHALANGVCEMQWQTPSWNEKASRFYRREGATGLSKIRFTLTVKDDSSMPSL
jgi:GNAT superfamily N-acetyltransferase